MKVRKEFQITIPVERPLRDKHGLPMAPLGKTGFFIVLAVVLIVIYFAFHTSGQTATHADVAPSRSGAGLTK